MPMMERRRRTRKGFFPPVVSTHDENGIRSRDPEREGAATRDPTSRGLRPRIPLRFFAVGPKSETAANPMKNPRVAPVSPWAGVPNIVLSACGSVFILAFPPGAGPEAHQDSTGNRMVSVYNWICQGESVVVSGGGNHVDSNDIDRRPDRLLPAAAAARSAVCRLHLPLRAGLLEHGRDQVAGRPVLDLPSPRDPCRQGKGCHEVLLPDGLSWGFRFSDLGRGADARHHFPKTGKGGVETDGQRGEPRKGPGPFHRLRIRPGGQNRRRSARSPEHPLCPHRNERRAVPPATQGWHPGRPWRREATRHIAGGGD